MKTKILTMAAAFALIAVTPLSAQAREVVVMPGVVGPVGVVSGVDTQGPGTLTVGNQNINTSNDAGGGLTTDAADTATVVFNNTSTVTGFTGTVGATFLHMDAGTNANTVTFNDPVFSTTFSVLGTGIVNFNGGFTSNTGSTMDFAGDGFINVGAAQTVVAAVTNTAGAGTGTLRLNGGSTLDGAVGAASGLKLVNIVGGNALITGQVNSFAYSLNANTLNVGGAFAIPVAGVINTTLSSDLIYGTIVPVGAATVGNALQVNVNVAGIISNGANFDIVDAGSGTSGSTVTATDNSARYTFLANPTTNGLVRITNTSVPLAVIVAPVVNPIAGVLAPIIDALPVTLGNTPLLTAISTAPTAAAVAAALSQLAPGTANRAAPQVANRVTQRFQELWASQLERTQGACGPHGQDDDKKKLKDEDASPCQPEDLRAHWWGAAFGSLTDQGNTGGFEGYKSDSLGGMLAWDVPLNNDTRAGVGVRYAHSNINGNTFDTDSDVNSYQGTAYLGYAPGPWFANAALVYGFDDYSGSRHVVLPGVNSTAKSDYDGHQYSAYGSTGYHIYAGDAQTVITPNASLQYTRLHADGYTETGGGAINLRVNSQTYDFVQSGLGVKVARSITLSDAKVVRPEVHANWMHSFGDDAMTNTAAFTSGGAPFTTRGLKSERNTYDLGAGLVFAKSGPWTGEAVYDFQWRNDSYREHQAMVQFVLHL